MKRASRWLFLFVLFLALSSLACGLLSSAEEETAPAQTQVETAPPAAEAQPPASDSGSAATETEPAETSAGVQTDEIISLQSVSQTLSELNSYRTLITIQTHDGTEVAVAESYSANPAAHRVEVEFSGVSSVPGVASTTVATIDGVTYSLVQGACVAVPAEVAWLETENPLAALGNPDTIVGSIAGARRVMPNQVVNGIEARHYVFDRVTVEDTHFQFNTVAGELFIAEAGDYVVRYTVEGQGRSGLLGAAGAQEGAIRVTFDVTDVNHPLDIVPPSECAAATLPGEITLPGLGDGSLPGLPQVTPPSETDWIWEDDDDEGSTTSPGAGGTGDQAATPAPPATTTLPRLPDAFNLVTDAAGNETYHTNYAFDDTVAFYRQEMATRGWSIYNEITTPISQTMDFTRSGSNLRVTITRDPNWNYTSVIVNWP